MTAVNRFMESYSRVYSEGMYTELLRRYPKISSQMIGLYEEGKISTTDPQKLTSEDIKEYVIFQRERGLKDTSISHDLSSIKALCMYSSGNICVDTARAKYPMLFQKKRHVRLPVVEKPEFREIVQAADRCSVGSSFQDVRSYAITMLAFGAGLRTQELQFAKVRYMDPDIRTLFLDHVKGMNTYGESRTVPIRPEAAPIMRLYLSMRDSDSEYLFYNKSGGFLSTNSLGKDRNRVVGLTGVEFDFRKARRTYAQYLVDEGVTLEWVAVILGHTSSKTTEQSYARPRDDRVVRAVMEKWRNNEEKEVFEDEVKKF